MGEQLWSWILTAVGLTGFLLAGRRVWWSWYVNIGCQGLWFAYAIVTGQWGFIVAALAYTVVFTQNAIRWTRERAFEALRKFDEQLPGPTPGGIPDLTEHDREVAERAWDEGARHVYTEGGKCSFARDGDPCPYNPYRGTPEQEGEGDE